MARILITGGTGFIGRHLCQTLVVAGHEAIVAVRSIGSIPESLDVEARRVPGLDPDTDWTEALRDVEVVIHVAAHTDSEPGGEGSSGEGGQHQRINVDGTIRLARDCARAQVRRLILMSTAKVHGEVTVAPLTENSPAAPVGAYAGSKWAAEQAMAASELGNVEIVIVRPPPVYGPGMRSGNLMALMSLALRTPVLPLGGVKAPRSLLAVANLADALRVMVDHPNAAGRTYLINDGEDTSVAELLRMVAAAGGRRLRLLPFPESWLRTAASIVGRRDTVQRLCAPFQVDSTRLRTELGWIPPSTVVQGMNETGAWLAGEDLRA